MKDISNAALDALDKGEAIVTGAVQIDTASAIKVWGGNGILPFGDGNFLPLGDRALVETAGGALGGAAQGTTLSLSGIEQEALAVDDSDDVAGKPVTLWRLIFDKTATVLLGANIWDRGRADDVEREDEVGGLAKIMLKVESAARGLGRRGARMRSDADQRLIKADDGFFKNVSYAGEKTLYWGGTKPVNASTAIGGAPSGGGSASIFGNRVNEV